ncbi:MAG: M20/M25/M40 family metallo-hydrolase [Candidatus Dormibacteraeota bacterium]|nr:M20/M25/M40 family metallo-hydrolase [Candidatus Dormibacteraeota bacterium]
MNLNQALDTARESQAQAESDYFELLRIPSVSALSRHSGDCRRAAEYLVGHFRRIGFESSLVEGDGHPTVRADWLGAPGKPLLTIYGHYDVQPPDPVEQWISPPFEPTVRDGNVYARGAADSKGNHFACLKAAEYAMAAGGPAVNLRFLIEGEEEGDSKVLPAFLEREAANLKTDFVLIDDGGFAVDGHPALITGLRGIVYTEIEVTGPAVDLHSGGYGGVASNPFNTLGHVIAGLKGRDGRVNVPGFYDAVRKPDAEELASWERIGITEQVILGEVGTAALEGELEYPVLERMWARPTLDVHGVMGGFTDEGTKTVIPSRATAKVSMRLVPFQDPALVFASFANFCESLATPGTVVKVRQVGVPAPPVLCGTDHAGARAAGAAFEAVWGTPITYTRSGGSIPVSVDFQRALGAPLIITGFNQVDDRAHSPNENMSLLYFHRGVEFMLHYFDELSRV